MTWSREGEEEERKREEQEKDEAVLAEVLHVLLAFLPP